MADYTFSEKEYKEMHEGVFKVDDIIKIMENYCSTNNAGRLHTLLEYLVQEWKKIYSKF